MSEVRLFGVLRTASLTGRRSEDFLNIIDLCAETGFAITEFASIAARAALLGSGGGAAHIYVVQLAPGGVIGVHEAGFDQLFVPVQGSGWAAGADAVRHPIHLGQAAVFQRGETHAKGSASGLVALMVQVEQLSAMGAATHSG
jgi:hypothetical protein